MPSRRSRRASADPTAKERQPPTWQHRTARRRRTAIRPAPRKGTAPDVAVTLGDYDNVAVTRRDGDAIAFVDREVAMSSVEIV
jgi:hypothetical protein